MLIGRWYVVNTAGWSLLALKPKVEECQANKHGCAAVRRSECLEKKIRLMKHDFSHYILNNYRINYSVKHPIPWHTKLQSDRENSARYCTFYNKVSLLVSNWLILSPAWHFRFPLRWSHAKSWSHWLRSVRRRVVGCWVPVGRWLSSGAMTGRWWWKAFVLNMKSWQVMLGLCL